MKRVVNRLFLPEDAIRCRLVESKDFKEKEKLFFYLEAYILLDVNIKNFVYPAS